MITFLSVSVPSFTTISNFECNVTKASYQKAECCARQSSPLTIGYDSEVLEYDLSHYVPSVNWTASGYTTIADYQADYPDVWPELLYKHLYQTFPIPWDGSLATAAGRLGAVQMFYAWQGVTVTLEEAGSPLTPIPLMQANGYMPHVVPSYDDTYNMRVYIKNEHLCSKGVYYEPQAGGALIGNPVVSLLTSVFRQISASPHTIGCHATAATRQIYSNATHLYSNPNGDMSRVVEDTARAMEWLMDRYKHTELFVVGGDSAGPLAAIQAAHYLRGRMPRKIDAMVLAGGEISCGLPEMQSCHRSKKIGYADWSYEATVVTFDGVLTDRSTQCPEDFTHLKNLTDHWLLYYTRHDPFLDAGLQFYTKLLAKNEHAELIISEKPLGHNEGCLTGLRRSRDWLSTEVIANKPAVCLSRIADYFTHNATTPCVDDPCNLLTNTWGGTNPCSLWNSFVAVDAMVGGFVDTPLSDPSTAHKIVAAMQILGLGDGSTPLPLPDFAALGISSASLREVCAFASGTC